MLSGTENLFHFAKARCSRRVKFRFKLYYASTTFPLRFSDEANGKRDIIIVTEKRGVIASFLAAIPSLDTSNFTCKIIFLRDSRIRDRSKWQMMCFRGWDCVTSIIIIVTNDNLFLSYWRESRYNYLSIHNLMHFYFAFRKILQFQKQCHMQKAVGESYWSVPIA